MSKRRRIEYSDLCQDVPVVGLPELVTDPDSGLISGKIFLDAYNKYQAVYFPQILRSKPDGGNGDKAGDLSWRDLANLFDSLGEDDKQTFCIENAEANGDGGCHDPAEDGRKEESQWKPSAGALPSDFLRRLPMSSEELSSGAYDGRRGYCSFLVQDSDRVSATLERLPLSMLPVVARPKEGGSSGHEENAIKMRHGPCLWIFFGRNGQVSSKESARDSLQGRPEHTDSVSHDGTWHYQLSGVKEWHLRPTAELIRRWKERKGNEMDLTDGGGTADLTGVKSSSKEGHVVVKCREGDVLFVNTRLWWHRTVVPPQPAVSHNGDRSDGNEAIKGEPVPSVSYARDVYLDNPVVKEVEASKDEAHKDKMSNLDGMYAADDIEASTIIFTEEDMPECELHRSSTDTNCELIQLEDGMGAIVSCRDIKAGEFFCIAESLGDEGGEEEEEEEEDS